MLCHASLARTYSIPSDACETYTDDPGTLAHAITLDAGSLRRSQISQDPAIGAIMYLLSNSLSNATTGSQR